MEEQIMNSINELLKANDLGQLQSKEEIDQSLNNIEGIL